MRQTIRTMRQDAWTSEDDALLAEIVLRHIREGSTQLAGFNEASRKLGRTAAACGFRWNACVRKQQKNIIEIAKEERKDRKAERVQAQLEGGDVDHPTATLMSWAQVLRFLRQEKNTAAEWASRWRSAERQCNEWKQRFLELEKEHRRLNEEHRSLRQEFDSISDDYRVLVQIVDRARKATLKNEDSPLSADGFLYRIDENGNLERLLANPDLEQAE
ncbi:RsfA family transcriptional regulator [Alicyclobacillus tolerans]|uniref:Prespore-specific regulator n=2 Tax=Alicyclobacillus tolerans TaxID=90970 RepID=A0ABT9LVS2_9BACL|nr:MULTISPECIES: RsfA family transcriptional regulator [Alicyclobacillus]MDP9728372.1 prespore-specific regulator [Alicyclobacillus tengchongensis]SHK13977.1 prespore-specific regulator [Alicyclobacillus montanus]